MHSNPIQIDKLTHVSKTSKYPEVQEITAFENIAKNAQNAGKYQTWDLLTAHPSCLCLNDTGSPFMFQYSDNGTIYHMIQLQNKAIMIMYCVFQQ